MMNNYFVKYIRFAYMDREYFYNTIANSEILNDKTKFEVASTFVDNPKYYVYKTEFIDYPRNHFNHFFMASYDIKSLKQGDLIVSIRKSGIYKTAKITKLVWKDSETRNVIDYVTLDGSDDKIIDDVNVDDLVGLLDWADISSMK